MPADVKGKIVGLNYDYKKNVVTVNVVQGPQGQMTELRYQVKVGDEKMELQFLGSEKHSEAKEILEKQRLFAKRMIFSGKRSSKEIQGLDQTK